MTIELNAVQIVITSAAVGAIVGALITGMFGVFTLFINRAGQFKRDRWGVARMIFEDKKNTRGEEDEGKMVGRFDAIVERLKKIIK